jgi:hypothetical protein
MPARKRRNSVTRDEFPRGTEFKFFGCPVRQRSTLMLVVGGHDFLAAPLQQYTAQTDHDRERPAKSRVKDYEKFTPLFTPSGAFNGLRWLIVMASRCLSPTGGRGSDANPATNTLIACCGIGIYDGVAICRRALVPTGALPISFGAALLLRLASCWRRRVCELPFACARRRSAWLCSEFLRSLGPICLPPPTTGPRARAG